MSTEEIKRELIDELNSALEGINANNMDVKDIIELDTTNHTVSIKFKYYVVEDDNYIGLSSY